MKPGSSNTLAPIRLSVEQSEILNRELQRLFDALDGAYAAVLATIDGFELASRCPNPRFNAPTLSAMASSLAAISSAVAREVAFDGCDRLLVESASGKIVLQPVNAFVSANLCIAVSPNALLGRTLWSIDDFAARLKHLK